MRSGGCRARWEAHVCLLEWGSGVCAWPVCQGLGCLTLTGPAEGPGFSHGQPEQL